MGHRTTQIAEVLAPAVLRQRRLLLASWRRAAEGDPKAIHRARVASRRLREALALAAAAAPDEETARARRGVRRVTRALGPVRELDVALVELDRAAARCHWPASAGAALRRALEQTRDERRRVMMRALSDIDRDDLRRRLKRVAASVEANGIDTHAVAAHLRRRIDRARTQAERCGTLYSVDRLHALRIAAKKLRYALEIVVPVIGPGGRSAVRALKAVQRRLGRLHDAQVLAGLVQALEADVVERAGVDWRRLLEDLERECRRRHADVVPRIEPLARTVRALGLGVALLPQPRRRAMIRASLGAGHLPARPSRVTRRLA